MFGFRLRRIGAALMPSRETLATALAAAKGLPPAGLLQVFGKKFFDDLDKVQETVS